MKKQQGKPISQKNKFSSSYTIIEMIKSSPHKKTYIVKNGNGRYLIAKKIFLSDEEGFNEISMMKTIKHPNIVAFHDLIVEKEHVYLIEEFCEEGDLNFHIRRQIRKKKAFFDEEIIRKWLLQLLLAIEYLHNSKIMHRDIRPQNIFLTSKGDIKLGSFKLSKAFQGERDLAITVIGSPYYLAPECVEQKAYDFKIDMWAFGCVLYQICSLIPIFNTKNIVELAKNIIDGKAEELPQPFSKNLNHILQKCLSKKSIQRPSARDLLRTPYFIEAMQQIILQKAQNRPNANFRIPIKVYKVHSQNLQKKKQKKTPRLIKSKEKNNPFPFTPVLPKIQQVLSSRITRKSGSKELKKQVSSDRIRNKEKQQVRILQDKIREKIKSKSRDLAKKYVNCPFTQIQESKCCPYESAITIKNFNTKEKKNCLDQKEDNKKKCFREKIVKTEQSKTSSQQSNNLRLLPPPLLPRPPQKKNIKSSNQKMSSERLSDEKIVDEKIEDFSETRKKEELQKDLKMVKIVQDVQNQTKMSLQKVFSDLKIEEFDEEQFSFDLEDENEARLNLKQEQNDKECVKTYKQKLVQLIDQINYKYCPNMQTIPEKTQQFDSNSFAQKFSFQH